MAELAANSAQRLPPIRQDLDLQPLGSQRYGRMVLYDPLSHKYYELRPKSAALLAHWHLADPAKICAAAAQQGIKDAQDGLQTLLAFLSRHGLLQHDADAGFEAFHKSLKKEATLKARLSQLIFFRMRLGNPEPLLNWLEPIAACLMTKAFRSLTYLAFILAAILLLRRPEMVQEAFLQMASFQGAIGMLVALGVVKIFHELGHAFQARHRGLYVPGWGILFMVGFPMPFTELSDSWRLASSRDRLHVDAGGIYAELMVAAWALLAFVFWPDGPMRNIFFVLAGISLIMSLFVNLNPLMRFDGYFILADAIGVKNLQPRSKALALWATRETLFGYGDPAPETLPQKQRSGMIFYAIAVYIYRIFLTFGIAALIILLLPKAISVPLALLYVTFFLLAPMLSEFTAWIKRAGEAAKSPRTWRSLIVLGGLLGLLLYPFEQKVKAPARLVPQNWIEVVAPPDVHLVVQPRADGDVQKGAVLWQFSDQSIAFDRARLTAQIAGLSAQIERSVASLEAREQVPLLSSEIARLNAALEELTQRETLLEIRAPFDGTLLLKTRLAQKDAPLALGSQAPLGYLAPFEADVIWALNGYIPASDLNALGSEPKGEFWPKGLVFAPLSAHKIAIGKTPVDRIDHPEALQSQGGPFLAQAAIPDAPQANVHAFNAQLSGAFKPQNVSVFAGHVVLTGTRKSYLARFRDHVTQVIVQNAGL